MKNMRAQFLVTLSVVGFSLVAGAGAARAAGPCDDVPNHVALQTALATARAQANGGFDLDMWATVVNRDGVVCAVAFTGANRGEQWPPMPSVCPASRFQPRISTQPCSPVEVCSACRRAIPLIRPSRTAATPRPMARPTIRWWVDASAG